MKKQDKEYDLPPWDDGLDDYDELDGVPEEGFEDPYADPDVAPRGKRRAKRRRLKAEEVKSMRAAEASSADAAPSAEGEEQPAPRRRRGFWRTIALIMTGGFLQKPEMRKAYPFLLLIAFIMSLYVWNVLSMQNLARRTHTLNQEIKDLRIRSNTITAIKMRKTQRDSILAEIRRRGIPLEEAVVPDTVIILNK